VATEVQDRKGALVHWLVAGRFGLGETGATSTLVRADFNEWVEKRPFEGSVEISDPLGTGTRTVAVSASSLKHFTLKHVVANTPFLKELAGKADAAAKLKNPSVEELEGLLGTGPLFEAAKAIVAPAPSVSDGGEVTGDVDAIFEKAEQPKKDVKSAISMFVKSTARSTRAKATPTHRQLRNLIEEAVYASAREILASDAVGAVEASWRGLRFLLTQCPKAAQMDVLLIEAAPGEAADVLRGRARADEGMDEPDAIFVPHAFDDLEVLEALADVAEEETIPIVTGVAPSLLGQASYADLPDAFEALERASNEEVPEWSQAWDAFRMKESTRFLCAVANRVVLHQEGAGGGKRTCFGSGVWAVAAMVAQSFGRSGAFARIIGKAGAISAPGVHTIEAGRHKDTAAPTEAFYAIQPADLLARNGILGLSSVRNMDQVVLTKAPMVRGSADAVPLPAQILTGRVVRFAYWVMPQLPEGCDSKTANEIYSSAATVFLFPAQEEAAHVQAAVTNIEGEAHVVVRAMANPAIAGIPFEIAFPLNLHWSVPAPEGDAPGAAPEQAEAPAATVEGEAKDDGSGGIAGSSVGFDVGIGKDES
jgi:type VI secretion system protein ImpC